MKLNILFIVMDLLTLLAYPIVYLHRSLQRLSKRKENSALTNLAYVDSVFSNSSSAIRK